MPTRVIETNKNVTVIVMITLYKNNLYHMRFVLFNNIQYITLSLTLVGNEITGFRAMFVLRTKIDRNY